MTNAQPLAPCYDQPLGPSVDLSKHFPGRKVTATETRPPEFKDGRERRWFRIYVDEVKGGGAWLKALGQEFILCSCHKANSDCIYANAVRRYMGAK